MSVRGREVQLAQRLAEEGRALDAVVMSGDIADKNNPDGYATFVELLAALGPMQPPAFRVVVVPGNHDVAPGLVPGDGERYRRFAESMRTAGFVTPLLDGVDTVPRSGPLPEGHLLQVGDVELIPINSSGYSQIQLDTGIKPSYWAVMEQALREAGADETAFRALGRLRRADAARIDESHLEDVARLLGGARALWPSEPVQWPVRAAVMHHQLLPVSVDEEVKAFESLTNLGQVRQFLREQEISIVLHGHKHKEYTYVDYVGSFDDIHAPPRPIRVVSGPAPAPGTFDKKVVARLLTFDRVAGMLRVEAVPAANPSKRARPFEAQRFPIVVPAGATTARTAGVTVVDADAIAPLHAQLLCLSDGAESVPNLVARLSVSPDVPEIAALYTGFAEPDPEAGDLDRAVHADGMVEKFEELVEWWQNPAPISGATVRSFTHGNRIFRYQGHIDQLEDVAVALENDWQTTRSVLVLMQPGADRIAEPGHEFPSFCLAQFSVTHSDDSAPRLECRAYFRKLELRYWWLVNIAEIASLQRRLVERLLDGRPGKDPDFDELEPGSITTIAARAHIGQSAVRVQIPAVDRYYAVSRERLHTLVQALVWEEMPSREQCGEEWIRILHELIPPTRRRGNEAWIAVEGIRYLQGEVACLSAARPDDVSLNALAQTLAELLAVNETFAAAQRHRDILATKYRRWRDNVRELVARAAGLTGPRILVISRG